MKKFSSRKTLYFIGLLVACVLAVSAAPLFAEEVKPTGDVTVAVMSKYVWRGYEMSRNSVVVQPSMTIGYKGFSANVWGNLDTHSYYSGTDQIPFPHFFSFVLVGTLYPITGHWI
jgi:hypothetical protein